jgi:type IV secretion system protein VirD4
MVAEQGRRLLLPDEVRRLPRDAQLLFVKGTPPLLGERLDYRRDPEFAGRAADNPLYARVSQVARGDPGQVSATTHGA